MDWYLKVLKQYTDFSGRARRKEYWMFTLFHFIIIFVLAFATAFMSGGLESNEEPSIVMVVILVIYVLATLIPSIALSVRRLHDIGKSGWMYLITFIPYIGGFILLIFACMEGESRPNKWGPNPKGEGNDLVIDQIGRE